MYFFHCGSEGAERTGNDLPGFHTGAVFLFLAEHLHLVADKNLFKGTGLGIGELELAGRIAADAGGRGGFDYDGFGFPNCARLDGDFLFGCVNRCDPAQDAAGLPRLQVRFLLFLDRGLGHHNDEPGGNGVVVFGSGAARQHPVAHLGIGDDALGCLAQIGFAGGDDEATGQRIIGGGGGLAVVGLDGQRAGFKVNRRDGTDQTPLERGRLNSPGPGFQQDARENEKGQQQNPSRPPYFRFNFSAHTHLLLTHSSAISCACWRDYSMDKSFVWQ